MKGGEKGEADGRGGKDEERRKLRRARTAEMRSLGRRNNSLDHLSHIASLFGVPFLPVLRVCYNYVYRRVCVCVCVYTTFSLLLPPPGRGKSLGAFAKKRGQSRVDQIVNVDQKSRLFLPEPLSACRWRVVARQLTENKNPQVRGHHSHTIANTQEEGNFFGEEISWMLCDPCACFHCVRSPIRLWPWDRRPATGSQSHTIINTQGEPLLRRNSLRILLRLTVLA